MEISVVPLRPDHLRELVLDDPSGAYLSGYTMLEGEQVVGAGGMIRHPRVREPWLALAEGLTLGQKLRVCRLVRLFVSHFQPQTVHCFAQRDRERFLEWLGFRRNATRTTESGRVIVFYERTWDGK